MNSIYRVVAVLIGGFIMKTIAIFFNLHPLGVAFSAIVGAVAGWILYDIPALIRAGVEAYNWLCNTKIKYNLFWLFFKGLGVFLASFLLVAFNAMFLCLYLYLASMVFVNSGIEHMISQSIGFGILMGFIVGFLEVLRVQSRDEKYLYLDKSTPKELVMLLVFATNPIAVAFWILYGMFYYLPKKTPTIASFSWKFCKKTFAIAHNGARRLCAIDSVLCGAAWLVSGNDPYVGIMVGTMLGIFHHRLMGAWAKMTLEKIRLESETKEIARIQEAMNSITGYRE